MEENTVLEDMRQQISLLKEKLENENIINDKLLRASMRQRLGIIRRNQVIEYVCALYVIIFGSISFRMIGFDWWFIIVTIALMIACMGINFYIHHNFNSQDLYSDDLLTVAKTMRQLKHRYIKYLYFGIPAIVVWLALLFFQMQSVLSEEAFIAMSIGTAVGVIIGAAIGLVMNLKVRKACDDIIRQIEN